MFDFLSDSQNLSGGIKQADWIGFEILEQIEEARSPIRLLLAGNMMPFVPFEFSTEQKISEKFYPGNPEPSVQVLGSREAPLTVKGRLHDKRQNDGNQIAYSTKNVLEAICRRGNMVRISLGDDFVRYGFLVEASFAMRNRTSMEYTLKFFLVSDTEPTQNPIIDGKKTLPRDLTAELQKINENMASNMLLYPDGYPTDIFDRINETISDVSEQVAQVTKFIDSIISAGEKTSAALNRAVSLIASAKSFVHKSAQRVAIIQLDAGVRSRTLTEGTTYPLTERAYPGMKKQNLTSGYRAAKSTLNTQREMASMQLLLMKVSDQLQAYLDSVSVTRHLVKAGETLQQISVKYYRDVDGWSRIYNHNKLSSTTLTEGTILEIPK